MILPVHIRCMIRRDFSEVLDIEARSFDYPWSDQVFLRALRQRNCIGMVAEHCETEKIVGYMIYELHKSYLALLNLAVDFDHRLCGVGREMATKLINKLSEHRRTSITLECVDTNTEAHLFWRRMGFEAVGVLHDFYDAGDSDAYRFEYRVGQRRAALVTRAALTK